MLNYEVSQIADHERRYRILALMEQVADTILVDATISERATELENLGFRTYDAMHIACAEKNDVDIFLTTDDKLLRLAARLSARVYVAVKNPLVWLSEGDNGN